MSKSISVRALAKEFHAEWRRGWQARDGNDADTPRWKTTKDTAWLQQHTGNPYCRAQSQEVDLNTDFDNLPTDWQKDNLEAAEVVIPIVEMAIAEGWLNEQDFEDRAGALIHKEWLARRRAAEGDREEFKALDVPFEQLEDWRKEQDRVQARITRREMSGS